MRISFQENQKKPSVVYSILKLSYQECWSNFATAKQGRSAGDILQKNSLSSQAHQKDWVSGRTFADTDVLWLHLFSARKVSSTCQLMKVESVEESDEQNPLYKDNEDNIIASKYTQMHYQNWLNHINGLQLQ